MSTAPTDSCPRCGENHAERDHINKAAQDVLWPTDTQQIDEQELREQDTVDGANKSGTISASEKRSPSLVSTDGDARLTSIPDHEIWRVATALVGAYEEDHEYDEEIRPVYDALVILKQRWQLEARIDEVQNQMDTWAFIPYDTGGQMNRKSRLKHLKSQLNNSQEENTNE